MHLPKFDFKYDEIIEQAIQMPGAVSVVVLLSILLPQFGLVPPILLVPMLMAFSIPTLWVFLLSVARNKPVSLKKHISLTIFFSWILYMVSVYPFNAIEFYTHSFLFIFGATIGLIAYSIYYLFFRIGKSERLDMSYRNRFFFSFIPSFLLMLIIGLIINIYLGEFIFGLAEGLA